MEPIDIELEEGELELPAEPMHLNMGPAHPAMHGTVRIVGELARISDHLTSTGAMAMELGAFTPFLWFLKAREMVWDILEEETGARLTHSFGRIGGMASPPTPAFKELTRASLK